MLQTFFSHLNFGVLLGGHLPVPLLLAYACLFILITTMFVCVKQTGGGRIGAAGVRSAPTACRPRWTSFD